MININNTIVEEYKNTIDNLTKTINNYTDKTPPINSSSSFSCKCSYKKYFYNDPEKYDFNLNQYSVEGCTFFKSQ